MDATASQGTVTVKTGSHSLPFPAGSTVAEIRAKLSKITTVDSAAKAYVGNTQLDENQVVSAGQVVTFIRKMGEKG